MPSITRRGGAVLYCCRQLLGLRGHTINPAPIVGRMSRSIEEGLSPGHEDEIRAAYVASSIPMGRYGNFEDANKNICLRTANRSSLT
jgi:hypothetical protein